MRVRKLGKGNKLPKVPPNMTEVAINEEYGFRLWRFLFFGSRQEFIDWWQKQQNLDSFFQFHKGRYVFQGSREELHDRWKSGLPLPTYFIVKGVKIKERRVGIMERIPVRREQDIEKIFHRSKLLLHIHEEDDSCLLDINSRQRFYHAGYIPTEKLYPMSNGTSEN